MEPDLRCYHHPEREATSQCDRCGDYLCGDCVHEHDQMHVCERCLEDIRPREEIGKSAKIACVLNALACSFWLADLFSTMLPLSVELIVSVRHILLVISVTTSVVAALLALSGVRSKASGELLFRLSVLMAAGSSAIFIAVELMAPDGILGPRVMLIIRGCLALVLTSIVLLGASVWKKARPLWALIVALFAPLMFGAYLICLLVVIMRFTGWGLFHG